MDCITTFLNLVAPPLTFFSLCLIFPPYLLYKSFSYVFYCIFSEDVSGKVVLIAGASSGIGEHLAYEYARKRACLALVARREKALREVVAKAKELGSPDVLMIPGDVQKPEDCSQMVEETISHFGRFNVAGITDAALLEEKIDITKFRTIMDTNFWGSAYTTYFAVPYLRRSRGKIIVLASSTSWLPFPRLNVYNASKAALISFFETSRVEIGSNVGILIVTPGFMESELTKGKALYREGKMEVDQDMRDVVVVSIVPVERVERCAKSILKSACRGDKQLIEPAWFSVTWKLKVLAPDVIEWAFRFLFLPRTGQPATEAPSKKILDITGLKTIIYPESILNPEIKTQ